MARPKIVVIGAGFAGLHALRRLERRIPRGAAEIVLIAPNDYMLYSPLLPQVAAGLLTPQSLAVSLSRVLRSTRMVPGSALGVDSAAKVVVVKKINGEMSHERYDRLVVAPGSLTRSFDIPGLNEFALGNKNLAEAVVLRDHVIAQLELANASDDPVEREERCRFIVVGGGYTGVETAASMERLTRDMARRYPELRSLIRWHLVDIAPHILPELGTKLGEEALDILRGDMGIEVKLGVSVKEVTENRVTLTDDRVLPCRTLVWTAGTSPSPLMETLGAEVDRGRLVVGADMAAPDLPGVFALGDAAAVPDLSKDEGGYCPPTAQYAQRQGAVVADNAIASLLGRPAREFVHKDLGLVVDLSGKEALARPLGYELSGLPALGVTRAYHLMAVPSSPTRARIFANWVIDAALGGEVSRLGFHHGKPSTFVDIERGRYLDADEVKKESARLVGAG